MNLSRSMYGMIALLCLFLVAPAAQSASIKERMAARVPEINALKDKGIIGENNMGYLEYRTPERPREQLVMAENKDRKAVYQAIAKSQKASVELVGKRRAKMIAENGVPGRWYQAPDGSWYKK